MSFNVTRAVTILTPTESDKMVVSEVDNGILFYSNDGSIVQRWSFDNISHVCLFSKRENKAQVKFICGEKRELKFKTLYEMQHFFQVMQALAETKKLGLNKVVVPPVRGPKVKEVVDKFETLSKKAPELVLPPKAKPSKVAIHEPSTSQVNEDQMVAGPSKVKFSIPLVIKMASTPPPPPPKRSTVSNGIMKMWKALTPKPKVAPLTVAAPKPILKKSVAEKIEVPKAEVPKVEAPKPENPKVEAPKPDVVPKPLKQQAPKPPAHKASTSASTSATAPQPKPQIQVAEKKVENKSELYRLVEQAKQKEVKHLEEDGFNGVKLVVEQNTKPKIVGVIFKQ